MGQAVVDLPDPLSPPPAESGAMNTDDLLAQMAGEEIDRLLAEQEGERAPVPPAPAHAAAAPSPVESKPIEPKSVETVSAPVADALDGVLGSVASEAGPDPVAALAAAAPAAQNQKSSAELLDEELAADEAQSALNSGKFHAAGDERESTESAPVPIPLRVLAWVNAPLDSCPDHVREALGKVAIVTAVNALAVLLYVLFFRPHHGG